MTAPTEPQDLEQDTAVVEAPAPRETPAAPSSPLASLRQRRADARRRSRIDVVVPGYDPPVYVRYRALTPDELERISARHAKTKASDRTKVINATLLATACVGVFEVDPVTGAEVSVDDTDREGEWPRFDDRLAVILGVEAGKATDVVEALYVEPMHILSVGDEVAAWSSARDQDLRRAEQGD